MICALVQIIEIKIDHSAQSESFDWTFDVEDIESWGRITSGQMS